MDHVLKDGQVVYTGSGGMPCTVEELLGSGGQGDVYKADLEGRDVALKWFKRLEATPDQRSRASEAQHLIIEELIRKGKPNDKFLWPMELVAAPGVSEFGYIMPLREPRFKSIVDLVKRRIEPSFRALATAGFELADSFLQIHSNGWSYRDINFGNVFFDPTTGDVLICDNDNVSIDTGEKSLVMGTPRFMAPEIVRGEAPPSTATDLYSLAVLLFYMFMVAHPLEGIKEYEIHSLDLPAMNKLYGTNPVFIYDPADDSNRPVPGYQDNAIAYWRIYPDFLKELFIRTFTEGIRDPQNGRARESEWRAAMVQLRDSIVYCSSCGAENFYEAEAPEISNGQHQLCWNCKGEIILPYRLKIRRNVVMLNHDTKLYPHHLDQAKAYDFTQAVAEVTRHPVDPNIWGLKNLGGEKWVDTTMDGTVRDVEPQRSVTLALGTKINFGKAEGEIVR